VLGDFFFDDKVEETDDDDGDDADNNNIIFCLFVFNSSLLSYGAVLKFIKPIPSSVVT
jgi:hypothetical protein